MEKENKEKVLLPEVYAKLLENEAKLTSYLTNIRHRTKTNKSIPSLPKFTTLPRRQPLRQKKPSTQVRTYVEDYMKLVKEATSSENFSGRRIITKLLQYLQEFPTMAILVQTINSYGRTEKKLCLDESAILGQVNDEMIPLFQKIIQKVQLLKKQIESKKLMELGQRISHLQKVMDSAPKKICFAVDGRLRLLEPERVEKYLIMEDNITRAEKNFGKFSQTFHKNQETFSNINRVYMQIRKSSEIHH